MDDGASLMVTPQHSNSPSLHRMALQHLEKFFAQLAKDQCPFVDERLDVLPPIEEKKATSEQVNTQTPH